MRYVIFALLLAGCGNDLGESGVAGTTEAKYNLSCKDVTCPTASDTSNFSRGDFHSFTCMWNCADYGSAKGAYVALTFEGRDGECWELASEHVSTGLCGY